MIAEFYYCLTNLILKLLLILVVYLLGSHDGEIVVWNYNSEIAMSKMHCEDSPKDGLESVSRDSRPNSSADKSKTKIIFNYLPCKNYCNY